jgi:hypothetical protein
MHGAHITLEGDQHTTSAAPIEHIDVASTPVHVEHDPAALAAELRKAVRAAPRLAGMTLMVTLLVAWVAVLVARALWVAFKM